MIFFICLMYQQPFGNWKEVQK